MTEDKRGEPVKINTSIGDAMSRGDEAQRETRPINFVSEGPFPEGTAAGADESAKDGGGESSKEPGTTS